TLLVLRTIYDALIAHNMRFPVYVDRIGGGVFGLVTGFIVVGMLTIGFQLLPFPPSFLGFSRYTLVDAETREAIPWPSKRDEDPTALPRRDWSKVEMRRESTWLNPAGFTLSLVSHLSSNSLRGREDVSFSEV